MVAEPSALIPGPGTPRPWAAAMVQTERSGTGMLATPQRLQNENEKGAVTPAGRSTSTSDTFMGTPGGDGGDDTACSARHALMDGAMRYHPIRDSYFNEHILYRDIKIYFTSLGLAP